MLKIENTFLKKYLFSCLTFSMIIFLLITFILNKKVLKALKYHSRQNLFTRIQTTATALDISKLVALSDEKNSTDKHHKHIRKSLQNLLSVNSDVRMFYLITKDNQELVCLADSDIVETSNFFSQNIYQNAVDKFNNIFLTGKSIIYGPVSDRFGKWLLVLIPIKDIESDKIIAVFGMDVSYKLFNSSLLVFKILSILLALLVCILLFTISFIVFYYSKVKSLLKTEVPQYASAEKEKKELTGQLKEAISQIKILSGCLPICSSCKKIRDGEEGEWVNIETYISKYSEAEFSHGICAECAKVLYPKSDKKE